MDPFIHPVWVVNSFSSRDFLDMVLPTDESILEALTGFDKPWQDLNHISYFLLDLDRIESGEFHLCFRECVDQPLNPLDKQGIYVEVNMANIS